MKKSDIVLLAESSTGSGSGSSGSGTSSGGTSGGGSSGSGTSSGGTSGGGSSGSGTSSGGTSGGGSSSSGSGSSGGSMGINADSECLTNGQCSMSIYPIFGMEGKSTSGDEFVNDLFTGLTMFIGTVVVFGMIISALMYIFAGANEGLADKGKNGLKYSIIGLLLVIGSYVIVKGLAYIISGE